VTKFAPLFLRQLPDAVTHNERSVLAVVPHHEVTVHHLAMPHFRAERRIDRAVRAVYMGIAVLGVDLLNPRASSQGGGRLQCVGTQSEHNHIPLVRAVIGGVESSPVRTVLMPKASRIRYAPIAAGTASIGTSIQSQATFTEFAKS